MKKKLELLLLKIYNRLYKRNVYLSEEEVMSFFDKDAVMRVKQRVAENKEKKVAFFCMSISMWKYDTLYKALEKHSGFHPIIFIAPRHGNWQERKSNIKAIVRYCEEKGYNYIPLKNDFFNIGQNLNKYDIDIAFYTQPYANVICKEYGFEHLRNSLLCYVPYGYYLAHQEFCYASLLNKIAWRNFYPAEYALREAYSFGQDEQNIAITGYPAYDMYIKSSPMKWKEHGKKRIIWAPHFSIAANGWMHLSSFIQICEYMVELADRFKREVQFAFKPHPNLYSALCDEWGMERTEQYYQGWANGSNTMLCTNDNYPLFKSSDAMIHDCGSFLMEYLYTQKPCMYLFINSQNNFELNEAGKAAMSAHYKAYKKEDIERFVVSVVLSDTDTMEKQRALVLKNYIVPQDGESATANIIKELENL